jgi:hypothetical protein
MGCLRLGRPATDSERGAVACCRSCRALHAPAEHVTQARVTSDVPRLFADVGVGAPIPVSCFRSTGPGCWLLLRGEPRRSHPHPSPGPGMQNAPGPGVIAAIKAKLGFL